MDQVRQLAIDPPPRSAALTLGSHLLGRRYAADPRDWSLARLMEIAEPTDALLQKTIAEVKAETTYFSDWRSYLILWRWLKKQPKKPPSPTGDTTPGWELTIQLDQGQTGHCVGFGWAGWVDAKPVEGTLQNADGHAIYYECKVIDGEPLAENGSYVRSGALALRNRGRLAALPSPSRRRRSTTGSTTTAPSWSARPGRTTCSTRMRRGTSSRPARSPAVIAI